MDFSKLSEYRPNGAITGTLIIVGVLCLFFFILFFILRKIDPLKKTPLWLVPFVWLVDMMNNFVKDSIGKRWKAYAPWFLTLTIFIFFANISSVYLVTNPTSYVIVTLALALCTFFIIQLTGIISLGPLGYLKGFTDPMPVMTPINIISEFTLPISLSLRLFGNVISGVCVSILVKKALDGWLALCVIPIMPFINLLFDIAFSLVQVAVFVILSVIFTSMKIKDEEKIYSK